MPRRLPGPAALLLAIGLALPAAAGDVEDCRDVLTVAQADPARAVAACRRLAEAGVGTAQHNLGTLYVKGQGVPHDYAAAAAWFRKAADQGVVVAQTALGVLYLYGLGVVQDSVQAYAWFTLAAARGSAAAAAARDRAAGQMNAAQIDLARSLAAAWKPVPQP